MNLLQQQQPNLTDVSALVGQSLPEILEKVVRLGLPYNGAGAFGAGRIMTGKTRASIVGIAIAVNGVQIQTVSTIVHKSNAGNLEMFANLNTLLAKNDDATKVLNARLGIATSDLSVKMENFYNAAMANKKDEEFNLFLYYEMLIEYYNKTFIPQNTMFGGIDDAVINPTKEIFEAANRDLVENPTTETEVTDNLAIENANVVVTKVARWCFEHYTKSKTTNVQSNVQKIEIAIEFNNMFNGNFIVCAEYAPINYVMKGKYIGYSGFCEATITIENESFPVYLHMPLTLTEFMAFNELAFIDIVTPIIRNTELERANSATKKALTDLSAANETINKFKVAELTKIKTATVITETHEKEINIVKLKLVIANAETTVAVAKNSSAKEVATKKLTIAKKALEDFNKVTIEEPIVA